MGKPPISKNGCKKFPPNFWERHRGSFLLFSILTRIKWEKNLMRKWSQNYGFLLAHCVSLITPIEMETTEFKLYKLYKNHLSHGEQWFLKFNFNFNFSSVILENGNISAIFESFFTFFQTVSKNDINNFDKKNENFWKFF